MNSLIVFGAGLALFFGGHVYSLARCRKPGRDLRVKMGNAAYRGAYSLVALAGLALLTWGYVLYRGEAPVIWFPPAWTRHVALALMLPALILLVAAYAPAGWIAAKARHPMLASVKVWATAHLIANGDLASIILFGSFLAYAVAGRIVAKRRGDTGRAGRAGVGDAIAVIAGASVYAAIAFWLHPILFGVAVVGIG